MSHAEIGQAMRLAQTTGFLKTHSSNRMMSAVLAPTAGGAVFSLVLPAA